WFMGNDVTRFVRFIFQKAGKRLMPPASIWFFRILRDANADRIATLRGIDPHWPGALWNWRATRQISECVTIRVDWRAVESNCGNPAPSRGASSYEPFASGGCGIR